LGRATIAAMSIRLYRRTDAGRKVWDTQNTQVPLEYRRVLGVIGLDTDPHQVRISLGLSQTALDEILEELEEQGLVKSIHVGPDATDLDFTGKFSRADLQAAQQHAREVLDFTAEFTVAELRLAAQKKL
jgi:hypothetical protein